MNYAIIAAGEGSRLAAEGVLLPKPLVPVDGRPMIQRLIDIFISCDAERISIIVNKEMFEVARYIREVAAPAAPVPVDLVVKSTPDSMHSFYELSRHIPAGKFILTTVDTIFDEEAFRRYVAAFAADSKADGYMAVTTYIDDEKPLYVYTDAAGRISDYCDEPIQGAHYISGGIYGLCAPRALDILQDCIASGKARMRNYQRALVAAGCQLYAYDLGKIIDVDHADDIAKANSLIQQFRKQ